MSDNDAWSTRPADSTDAPAAAPRDASPPPPSRGDDRRRSASPGRGRMDVDSREQGGRDVGRDGGRGFERDGGRENPGNNIHVSSLSIRVEQRELEEVFGKYGQIDKVQLMYDPHTRESRGFGFVTMVTAEEADAAIAGLHNTELQGKVMRVEKARRGRARTPTPGRYFGPPKDDPRGPPPPRSYRDDRYERPYDPKPYDSRYAGEDRRYDDRRGGDSYRDDRYRRDDRGPPPRRYDDRSYDRPRYDDRAPPARGDDRYDDRYGARSGGGSASGRRDETYATPAQGYAPRGDDRRY